MKRAIEIFEKALQQGVSLFLENGKLKYRAAGNELPEGLLSEIKSHKDPLIEYLGLEYLKNSFVPPDIVNVKKDKLPLSFAQQRMWLVDQIEGSAHYNVPSLLSLTGQLSEDAFEQALCALIERHEALRTCFEEVQGEVYQRISPASEFALQRISLEHLDPETQKIEVRRLADEEEQRPFDLSQDLMIRSSLLKLSDSEHVLLLTMHHIASDGESLRVLTAELSVLYTAFRNGEKNPLSPLPIQYGDYAVWQREWLQGEELERQLGYWQKHLADIPVVHSVPLDKPRPAQQSFAGALYTQVFDSTFKKKITAFCLQQDVTLFMFLQTAFSLLLSRYSDETDIVMGTPIAGRSQQEVESLIGFFVNTLVLRTDLSGDPHFTTLLAQNKQRILDAYEYQHIPFEMLVEHLQPERSQSHKALYQVVFAVQNFSASEYSLPDITFKEFDEHGVNVRPDYELGLHVTEDGNELMLHWSCKTAVFNESSLRRFSDDLSALLEGIMQNPNSHIQSLPLMTDKGMLQLSDWNSLRTAEAIKNISIHHLFESQAAANPENIAATFGEQSIRYQALNEEANQLAHYLKSQEMKPNAPVGVCIERSVDMLVGMLGILKAAGAYVLLDPELPQEELDDILESSGIEHILIQRELMLEMEFDEVVLFPLDREIRQRFLANFPTTNLISDNCEQSASQLACVMYTSDSAGVMVTHQNVLGLVKNSNYAQIDAEDVVAQASNVALDAVTFEIWTGLCNGASLVYIDKETLLSPAELSAALEAHSVTVLFTTTALINQVALTLPECFAALKSVLFAGEPVNNDAVNRIIEAGKPGKLLHVYGSAETTVLSISSELNGIYGGERVVSIGAPSASTQAYVLDSKARLLPIGAIGELYLGGQGVTLGYLNQPELTAQQFIENPYYDAQQGNSSKRLYRTGDRVRWLPCGELEFVGQVNQQVKVRGYNIDLSAIEQTLTGLTAIDEAIVIARTDETAQNHEQLIAFIVPVQHSGASTDSELITGCNTLLEESLPGYMVPDAIYALEKVPRLLGGTIDSAALQERAAEEIQQSIYVAPRNEIEAKLCEIWKTLLRVDQVGVHDNFFELGGHSLTATRLLVQLRENFSVDLPLKTIFNQTTIEKQAVLLAQSNDTLTIPAIEAVSGRENIPLSFAQQRLWYIDRLEGSTQYNQPRLLSLSGVFDTQAFEQALHSLVARHEVLRTCFEDVEGKVYQRVLPVTAFSLKQVSLEHYDSKMQDVEVKRLAEEEARQPFDLSQNLMIRSSLLKLSDEEHVLLLTTHHIAFDGWSMGVFYQELNALYLAYSNNQPSQLTPLPVQYSDYAVWQREWLQGEVLEHQLEYWRTHLQGMPVVHSLPLDKPRPAQQGFAGALHTQVFNAQLKEKITEFCRVQDVTLFMFLQTAFALLLSRYSNVTDIVMGTPIAGRTQPEVSPLIGFFVNTLVLRTDLSEHSNFTALLAQNKQGILDAFEYQHIPFEMLVEELQPERSLSHNPLFQITFALENNEHGELEFDGLNLAVLDSAHGYSLFDLALTGMELSEGLEFGWNYSTELFSEEMIHQLAASFHCLLESIVAEPETSLETLPLSPETQIQQLLFDHNATQADYPAHICLHELFEKQAKLTPDAVAAVFGTMQLTYEQLNSQANQLAHYLREQGVSCDTLVGLCVERSLDMLVSILGIIKAGGAYVPLDPELPKARIDYVLADTGMDLVLTQGSVLTQLPEDSCKLVKLDAVNIKEMLSHYPVTNPEHDAHSANQLAYVIYTSGSTGQPKGVMVTHQNVVGLAKDNSYVQIGAEDVVAQASNAAFDAATFEIWGALCNGARIAYIDKETLLSPVELSVALERHSISVMFVTTALFNQIAFTQPDCFTGLKSVLFGGEQVNYDAVNRIIEAGKPGQLLHVYGPTEATTFSTSSELNGEYGGERTISIGTPLANVEVFVLDVHKGVLPSGAVGELYIGGRGIARGYLNQTELTSERFIVNPFYNVQRAHSSEHLYRTGDLVRWLPNGELEFIGRVDHQVKVRGFRIELGEIEHQLAQCDAVKEALVVVHEDDSGNANKQLVAYVVPECAEGEKIDSSAVQLACRSELEQSLPAYMVPSVFVTLAEFSLTANGKIDRKKLPEVQGSDIQTTDYVASCNETQAKLCEIWQEVLKVEKVGIYDNFFTLGGDSIISIQMVARAKKQDLYFTVRNLFENQTVYALSQVVINNQQPLIAQEEVVGLQSLTPIQHFFFADNSYNLSHFNQSFVLTTPADFAMQQFTELTLALYKRHDVLRLRFSSDDGQGRYEPFTSEMLNSTIGYEDLSELTENERLKVLESSGEQIQRSLDLQQGPIFRAVYFDYGREGGRLLLVIHHIVVDGVSWRIIMSDINQAYRQLMQGVAIKPEQKTTSFQSWGEALAQYAKEPLIQSEREYWCEQLLSAQKGLNDRAEPAATPENRSLSNEVSAQLSAKDTFSLLGECNEAFRTQINELLLASLLCAYKKWSNNQSLPLIMEGHGREELFDSIDIGETVGWYTSIYPLTLNSDKNMSFEEVIKCVKEQYRAVPNNGIGFGILRYLSQDPEIIELSNTTNHSALAFNYLGQFDNTSSHDEDFAITNESAGSAVCPDRAEPYALSLNGAVMDGELTFSLTYSTALISSSDALQLLELFFAELERCIRTCQLVVIERNNSEALQDISITDSLTDSELEGFEI